MTELEKMRNRKLYNFSDPEIMKGSSEAQLRLKQFNRSSINDEGYRELLETLIPGIPGTSIILPPFFCDHGTGIRLAEDVFINFNCTFLDSGYITIGARTKIGPNCQLYTPQHPIDYIERRLPQETGLPITIGEDCWLGGGVVVCPGVTIGNRCIIAAGSVVTKNIPDDSLAAGNPAVVKRKL